MKIKKEIGDRKMEKVIGVLVFMLFFFSSFNGYSAKVTFLKGSLKTVKEKAANEGKLYFVNFTASWCMPCKLMDETTYTDPSLAYYISQNYVAAKVDIDDFDGIAYKQQYNVKIVPTILVFSSKGKLLGRYEESLGASKMLSVLKSYDKAKYRSKTATTSKPVSINTGSISRPPLKPDKPASSTSGTSAAPSVVKKGSGLFRFDVKRQASKGYSVQIGVFAEYGNVLQEAEKLGKIFNEPILVHIDQLQTRTVYRVMVGEFSSKSHAERFIKKVRDKGFEGFVKDLIILQ